MNTKVLLTATMLAVFFFGPSVQHLLHLLNTWVTLVTQGETGSYTLEEALEIQRRRIEASLRQTHHLVQELHILMQVVSLVHLLLLVQSLVVLQELYSSLEEDLANTQQWEEDKQNLFFSYFIIHLLVATRFSVNADLVLL